MKGRTTFVLTLATLVCGMWLLPLAARAAESEGQPGQGRDRGRFGGWRDMTPEERQRRMEEMRKQAEERLKEVLGVKDEAEWKIIQGRMDAVRKAQEALRGGRGFGRGFMMFDPRRQPGGEGRGTRRPEGRGQRGRDRRPETELGKKMTVLRELLQKEDSKVADISTALKALRDARAKAEKNLATAQGKLREVLTKRQEALLVVMGQLR